ncbi:hypothetical protein [Lysobacter sp. A3-1-A15]|uniref:hypothetical protein n=1 Tax=Novilysobacter viscosus TaxID=3098602 RepID=UPI002ED909AB
MLHLETDVLEQSTFLDNRIAAALSQASPIPLDVAATTALPQANIGWIFHTSFCCSTLLARALHLPPYQVALKEPLVLRRLADARHGGASIDGLVEPVTRLLARPWHPSGSVVVKPTHAALNIAGDLLEATPGSRGVIVTSSLEDFLVSNIKKSAETQAKIPTLVERAFAASTLHSRLPRVAFEPPDILAAAALQWAAQREICLDLIDMHGKDRLRVLHAEAMLDDLPGTTWRCAQWLCLPVEREPLVRRAEAVAGRNAKVQDVAYSRARRDAEARQLRDRYAPAVERALQWFDRIVRPSMRPRAIPLATTSEGASIALAATVPEC